MNSRFILYSFVLLLALDCVTVDSYLVGTTPISSRWAPLITSPTARRPFFHSHLAADATGGDDTPAPSAPTASTAASTTTTNNNGSTSTDSGTQRQALYGTTLEYPESYVRCGKCQAIYALQEEDLGRGRGRRLECAVCQHSWFQSKDRLMTVKAGEYEMLPMPERDLSRIQLNMAEGKAPKFVGNKKLYVGNIAFECHEEDLYEIFGKIGDVGDVSLVRDEEGKNRGFGFVTMRIDADGDKAIAELDGLAVRGRSIAVRESNN